MRFNESSERFLTVKHNGYSCEAVDETGQWRFYGSRPTLIEAKSRANELKKRFSNVRIRHYATLTETITP